MIQSVINDEIEYIVDKNIEENIRDYISYLIEDNLYDLMYGDMLGKYNIFDRKIVFEDLL